MIPIDRQRLFSALTLAAMALFVAAGTPPLARWSRWLRLLSIAAFVMALIAALVAALLWWSGRG